MFGSQKYKLNTFISDYDLLIQVKNDENLEQINLDSVNVLFEKYLKFN